MIKVTLDFKNINTKKDLIFYVGDQLKLVTKWLNHDDLNPNWDAFADNFGDIVYKEFDLNDLTDEEKEDIEWFKNMNELGLKNEDGVRDDLEITLINFKEFKNRNSEVANVFLEIIQERYEEMKKMEDEDEIVQVNIVIES